MPDFDVQPGHVDASPAFDVQPGHVEEEPGGLASALKWLSTPSDAMKPIIEENRKQAAASPSGFINKDSPDWLAGAGRFLSGAVPGVRPEDMPGETGARLDRFDQEHPKTSLALGIAGGMGNPANAALPATTAAPAAAEGGRGMLESMANKLAARTLKGTAGDYRELGKEGVQQLGEFLHDKGAVTFGASPTEVGSRVAGLPKATGEALGGTISALDQTGAQVSKRALAGQFRALEADALKGGPGSAPLAAKYGAAADAVLKDIETSGQEMMSFADAEKWKQGYQAPINYAKAHKTPLEMGAEQIASKARQGVEDAAQTVAEGSDNPDLLNNFLRAKRDSGMAQQAARMAEGAQGRADARGLVGPVAKGVSWTAAALSALHGNIPAAAGALAAGPIMQSVATRAPAAAAVALKGAAGIAEKVSSMARLNPAALGRYAPVLKSVAQNPDALAANLYVIGQTDPEGSDALRKSLETP